MNSVSSIFTDFVFVSSFYKVDQVEQDKKVVVKFPDPGSFDKDIVRLEQVRFE